MQVQLLSSDVLQCLLGADVHPGRESLEELIDAVFCVASDTIVDLLPCSLNDVVDKLGVGRDLALLATIGRVTVTLDSHQWFGVIAVQVPGYISASPAFGGLRVGNLLELDRFVTCCCPEGFRPVSVVLGDFLDE